MFLASLWLASSLTGAIFATVLDDAPNVFIKFLARFAVQNVREGLLASKPPCWPGCLRKPPP